MPPELLTTMDKQISDPAEVVKPAEEVETSKTTTEQTDQNESSETPVEEENLYKKQLEEAQALLKKKDDLIRKKDGSLKEERERRKAAEARVNDEEPEEEDLAEERSEVKPRRKYLTPEELDQKLAERDFTQLLGQFTNNSDEQSLIKHHYQNSIVQTGNVQADLEMAAAIANSHLVRQAKQAEQERIYAENLAAGYTMSKSYSKQGRPAHETDPRLKQAAAILDRIGASDAKKYLK